MMIAVTRETGLENGNIQPLTWLLASTGTLKHFSDKINKN